MKRSGNVKPARWTRDFRAELHSGRGSIVSIDTARARAQSAIARSADDEPALVERRERGAKTISRGGRRVIDGFQVNGFQIEHIDCASIHASDPAHPVLRSANEDAVGSQQGDHRAKLE